MGVSIDVIRDEQIVSTQVVLGVGAPTAIIELSEDLNDPTDVDIHVASDIPLDILWGVVQYLYAAFLDGGYIPADDEDE